MYVIRACTYTNWHVEVIMSEVMPDTTTPIECIVGEHKWQMEPVASLCGLAIIHCLYCDASKIVRLG